MAKVIKTNTLLFVSEAESDLFFDSLNIPHILKVWVSNILKEVSNAHQGIYLIKNTSETVKLWNSIISI